MVLVNTIYCATTMNWTGGTLQRTKHANKGVVQKQKAYFARARTHLQNGTNSPVAPFRPRYLQNDDSFELAGRLPAFGSGSVRHTGHSVRRHREATHRGIPPDHQTRDPDTHVKGTVEDDERSESAQRSTTFNRLREYSHERESHQQLLLAALRLPKQLTLG